MSEKQQNFLWSFSLFFEIMLFSVYPEHLCTRGFLLFLCYLKNSANPPSVTTQGERDWFSQGLLHHSFPASIGKYSVCQECTRFWLLQHFGCSDVKQIAEPTAWSPLDMQDSLPTPRYPINTSSMCTMMSKGWEGSFCSRSYS